MSALKTKPWLTLDQLAMRAEKLRAAHDELLDQMAQRMHDETPGVPVQVIRCIITKGSPCTCATVIRLAQESQP
jgi:hypothetical protein